MKQKLIDVLETICPNNVYLQGSLLPDQAYPNEFITFFTPATEDHAHYENDVSSYDWSFSVIYYSNDPELVATKPNQIRNALRHAGFISKGKGYDVPSDVPTHTGWAMNFVITEYVGYLTTEKDDYLIV